MGGGPAGSSAAITLARHGLDVVLVDKARFPRDKCCGDGLTTSALRRLEQLGLRPESVPSWQPVDDVWVRSPSGRVLDLPLPRGRGRYAAVARRVDLDAALLDLAYDAGVRVHDGCEAIGATADDRGVTVELSVDRQVRAPYVVAADGMWSALRKAFVGGAGYLGEWHAFRQYFRHTGPEARKLWVWFERDLLPGYAWSFPLPGGAANVGYGLLRTPELKTREMAARWRELLSRPQVQSVLGADAEPESPHKAWPIPAALADPQLQLTAAAGRVLFAGDAARATDPMTGEGIGQALETGELAAAAIIDGGPRNPGSAAAQYRRGVASALTIDHRFALGLSKLLRSPLVTRGALRLVDESGWTRRNFARWMFEDYPRATVLTPSRWRRGVFTGTGAYQ